MRHDDTTGLSELEQRERRLRAAVEGGFAAFYVLEWDAPAGGFRFTDLNTRAAEILGAAPDALIGRLFGDVASSERGPYFEARFRAVLESGEPFEEEYEVQAPEIPVRWLHYQVVPLPDGVAVSARDITRRKTAELELRASEERFRAVVNNVPGVFFTIVPSDDRIGEMRLDFVGENIERLTGLPASAFRGPGRRELEELLDPADVVVLREGEMRARHGFPYAVDVRLRHTDGTVRWIHIEGRPQFDEDGVPSTSGGVMFDITDRMAAEEALHLRERAIATLAQGVVITDATKPETPVVYVNPAFETLTGYTSAELLGRPGAFVHTGADESAVAAIREAVRDGRAHASEFRTRRKDGTTFWTGFELSPVVDPEGNVTHFVSIHSDETPRKRLEGQFLQAQKMEAVGRLAGGVAHDFNNVLLVIRGYSHVLMSMLGEGADGWEESKEIESAATRASELVRQLLAFSRSQVIQSRVLDLNEVARDAQSLLEPLIGEDAELVTALGRDVDPVKSDATQIQQVVVNLALNARDAMPNGGRLLLRTRNVEVTHGDALDLAPGSYVALSVEDTGYGMDAETRARVFEPFFSTKAEGIGTGLGLSTVYGIVKQSGGDITIVSAPGEGTNVTVYFPRATEPVEPARPQLFESAPAPARDETVLLVEDNDDARALVSRLLREEGYDVHAAALPEEALRLSDELDGRIHLLLSDVVMPQMSGTSLAKIVLERRPDTRVLFVSGYIERADDIDIVSSGADFLQKPFTPAELVSTVRRVLDKRETARV